MVGVSRHPLVSRKKNHSIPQLKPAKMLDELVGICDSPGSMEQERQAFDSDSHGLNPIELKGQVKLASGRQKQPYVGMPPDLHVILLKKWPPMHEFGGYVPYWKNIH